MNNNNNIYEVINNIIIMIIQNRKKLVCLIFSLTVRIGTSRSIRAQILL